MSSEHPFAHSAHRYLEAGWQPFPLPWGRKKPPPTGITGHGGHPPTLETVRRWATAPAFRDDPKYGAGNVGLVMPDTMIGIDIDHYGNKTGGDDIAALETELGLLPPSPLSTARADGISGIRFYRVPAGRKWKESLSDSIEIIQRTHRYAAVWPSIHDKLGTQYRWVDDMGFAQDGYMPYVTDIYDLPAKWVKYCTEDEEYVKPTEQVTFTEQDQAGVLTGGEPCKTVKATLDKYGERKETKARYISARNTTLELVRNGEQGHSGVHSAVLALRELYLEDTQELNRDTSGEFTRELKGAIGIVLGAPTAEEDKGCCGGDTDPLDGWEFNPETGEVKESRWVDLDEFLDGTYEPPPADLGARRDDSWQFLYPGKWHTLVGLTTAGKTFWALWQAKAVMESGDHVMYIHFEEGSPGPTLGRLIGMGVDKETLRKQFHWGHTHQQWSNGEMAGEVEKLSDRPALAVLDGINAACGMHDWDVSVDASVGKYCATFVKPLLALGIAVMSLGHPVRNVQRQGEAYGYGAAGWLNNPDGCALRMETVKEWPIGKGKEGGSELFVVKDRYAEVQQHGNLEPNKGNMPWYYMGRFIVDDTRSPQKLRVSTPALPEEGGKGHDKFDDKADRVLEFMQSGQGRHRFETASGLLEELQGAGYWSGTKTDLGPTLSRLVNRGVLEWPKLPEDAKRGTPRPGWLVDRSASTPRLVRNEAIPALTRNPRFLG